jgi:hypothetical protein
MLCDNVLSVISGLSVISTHSSISSSNRTDPDNISEILLKDALNIPYHNLLLNIRHHHLRRRPSTPSLLYNITAFILELFWWCSIIYIDDRIKCDSVNSSFRILYVIHHGKLLRKICTTLIGSVCNNCNPVISHAWLIYCHMSNTVVATGEAGTADPSETHEFTPTFSGFWVAHSVVFCVVFCRSSLVLGYCIVCLSSI